MVVLARGSRFLSISELTPTLRIPDNERERRLPRNTAIGTRQIVADRVLSREDGPRKKYGWWHAACGSRQTDEELGE